MRIKAKLGDEMNLPHLGISGTVVDIWHSQTTVAWAEYDAFTGERLAVKEIIVERIFGGWVVKNAS
jgi:hypothetical protein